MTSEPQVTTMGEYTESYRFTRSMLAKQSRTHVS